ncbi:Calx-beta domain-containing protein [Altericista sp. CCNU0014]|uniref:Calx-beta domain-containing protein n=1 Tax=Altericista sp. CCNU0014 TaxID=3082949 RepID=UPI0038517620
MAISFNQIGAFQGVSGGSIVLDNPTSLDFGPDGRLYVAEQNGAIGAFTVALQNGQYIATAYEELTLPNGGGVVKSIMNHNDSGANQPSATGTLSNRQVTGIVVAGTAANPVLYISSSDPRIATNNDSNLDTNSGIITRVTKTGSTWNAVDIVRGLPRSEENHSTNGMVLSADGTKLYLAVGGNTNNGAPSQYFAYTGEYALSGTVLEIDLTDINSRPILTDADGGQVGGNAVSRQYIYDLPTLDDPTVPNNGVRENANGLDVAGPFGGNDGFNMAILPADAPLRIYADGFRNNYDLVLSQSGKLYTVDNGSNSNLGGNPIIVNGEATNQPNNGGTGDPEPLYLIQDGGYYGHPNPVRSNQNLAWTVYNDSGTANPSLSPNSVPDLSALVPNSVAIPDNFLIDPSKFTGNAARLQQSGIRIPASSASSPKIVSLGSSSNGLVEYTDANAFGGALQGALLVTQFNNNVTVLNLNNAGTGLEPLKDPGNDGILGTGDDVVVDSDGVYPLIGGFSTPLDVITGPNGTIWVAEIGGDFIKVFAPSSLVLPNDPDFDDDLILNVNDPFIRDATNGGAVTLLPGQTLLWDFDANQDNNLPGANGYGGGLTGVMINGSTDFEQFFNEPSGVPGEVKLDNVKFITAAGGGTTVIEKVSNGDPFATGNNGEYLFHTGVTISPTVDTFKIKWTVVNPVSALIGPSQQIGGYIGTGDQSNYLKIVAIKSPDGEIQVLLENNNTVITSSFLQADDLFAVPPDQKIFFELEIDPSAATATPTITYEIGGGNTKTVSGAAINLGGTAVLNAILGNYAVQGKTSGLAVGLLSSNAGQSATNTFQAVFADVEITATGNSSSTVLYRVNAGGPQVAAIDGGIPWAADTTGANSPYLVSAGSNNTSGFVAVNPGQNVPSTTPGAIFDTERWDNAAAPEMAWAFSVPTPGLYEVRLYMGNGFTGTGAPGQRVFDVAIEGSVLGNLDNVDLASRFGNLVGGMISNTVAVTDGTLNVEFLHGVENPLVNGIEILQIGNNSKQVSIAATNQASEPNSNGLFTVSLSQVSTTNTVVTYSVAGTATPGNDYTALSGSVIIPANQLSATVPVSVLNDSAVEGSESVIATLTGVSGAADVGLGANTTATVTIADDDAMGGKATLEVTVDSNNVQISNFGNNSFLVKNTGNKNITKVEIDVSKALYPDTVFDPFGLAGDSVAKPLTINTNGSTGIISPNSASYIGAGGTAGYEKIKLDFDGAVNGGFNPGETVGFSIDMDPNSVAGTNKPQLDGGSNPSWDVGGVSGAELIGSTFTVTFTDGTTATGQLQGAKNQAGSKGLASQGSPNVAVSLTVNGLGPGGVGTYNASGPSVIVNGPAGRTARVVLTKGFIQPVTSYAPFLANQLAVLAATPFPANNAVEFQTVDVVLTGTNQNISNLFNFSDVANYNFAGENQLPLGFVASAIDPANGDFSVGPVTQPIYLEFASQKAVSIATTQNASEPNSNGLFTVSLNQASTTNTVVTYSVAGTATPGNDYTALSGSVIIPANQLAATIPVSVLNDSAVEGSESVIATLTGVSGAADVVLGANTTATVAINDEDGPATGITIQAESIANVAGYRLESSSVASGGSMLSLVGGASSEIGTATFAFTGATGNYNVILGTFDENDGTATLQVSKNGTSIGSVLLNQNLGSGSVTATTKVGKTVASGVSIANGDSFTITGIENASEHARFDFIRFEPAGSVTSKRFQAESADSIINYRTENIGVASGGQILSFVGGASGESGSATFVFGDTPDELAGTYNFVLGTFDENDGLASFTVVLNDVETSSSNQIGSLLLNANLGSGVANASTFVSPTIATGISLTPGDSFTVNGFENGSEHARFDYIQLLPTI